MNRLSGRLEQLFVDITYAEEAGPTARNAFPGLAETIDNTFTAITFAEAGEPAAALKIMGSSSGTVRCPSPPRHNDLGCFCMGKA